MIKQVEQANKNKSKLFVSVHCDYEKAASGCQALYISSEGKKLGNRIAAAVKEELGMQTKTASKRNDLYELNATDMTACIFETGSIKEDLKVLRDKPKAYGRALAKGICDYLGVKFETSRLYIANTNLTIREGSSLKSKKKSGKIAKGAKFKITRVNSTGKRGYIPQVGWVTITSKYVKNVK